MPEARSDPRLRPALPAAPPRRARGTRSIDGRAPAIDPPWAGEPWANEPSYPVDPPLVDERIPVKEPHAAATAYSRAALRHRFPAAQVGDDLHMLFSEPGKAKRSRLSPDVMVALAVPRRDTRAEYDADRLGAPDFVLEVLSPSTWDKDVGRKLDCYQRIGVRECLLFDPTGKDLAGVGKELWGFALTPERREPLAELLLPNGERGVYSTVLGLAAYVAERTPPAAPNETWALAMRWHDPATGEYLTTYDEAEDGRLAEKDRADAAEDRADAAERRAHAAEQELARLRLRLGGP